MAALKHLRSNPFIVIKPTDKGSSSVIMDKDNYISEGYRQLGNPSHYKKLNKPIFHSTGQKKSMKHYQISINKISFQVNNFFIWNHH